MSEGTRQSWSDLTLRESLAYVQSLSVRVPLLAKQLEVTSAPGATRGADLQLVLHDASGSKHFLNVEIEQYASGSNLPDKVSAWAVRHLANPNTTTVVISLVLQAFHNRLVAEFAANDSRVAKMVFSSQFRMYPGTGDGKVPDEIKNFLTSWIERRLS